jgi:mono/diheme cytochrome c family protein
MSRLALPIAGAFIVGALAFLLIVVTIVRPWAGPDNSWRTHLNQADEPVDGFGRVPQAVVGEVAAYPGLTDHAAGNPGHPGPGGVPSVETGSEAFITAGCALCHGLDASGGTVGAALGGAKERRVRTLVRRGPGGMPAFDEDALPPAALESLALYLGELPSAPTPGPAAPTPTPWPYPTPTPAPTPTPTPPPLAVAGKPAATPTPDPTPTPTPEPLDPVMVAAGRSLFLEVGCDLCHGRDAAGADDGPSLAGSEAGRIREQVRDPVSDPGSAYTNPMDPYTTDDLLDPELEAIISYLLSLGRDSSPTEFTGLDPRGDQGN